MPVVLQDPSKTFLKRDDELLADGDKETVYTLRPITKDKYREVIRHHTKKVPNRQTRAMDDLTDWESVSDDLLDFALVDWSGIVLNGAPVPCTTAHKDLLDTRRQHAILDAAGLSQIMEAPQRRAESFREPADVVR